MLISTYNVQPVVLCGGSGTRLWPLSRADFPKQFLSFNSEKSLFQAAAQRLSKLGEDNIIVSDTILVTAEEHRFLALEQLDQINIKTFAAILEPSSRNTAPALTLAALAATADGDDPILVVTPADQSVSDVNTFSGALKSAVRIANDGAIVTLGITPDRPEIRYGYIHTAKREGSFWHDVLSFVEKPGKKKAQEFLDTEGCFWNAGIFVLRASVWLKALSVFRPDILNAVSLSWNKKTEDRRLDMVFMRPSTLEFNAVPPVSIDYAVMERCPQSDFSVRMVKLDSEWSDLGTWDAISKILPKDEAGNASFGDVMTANTSNCVIHANSRLVALVGMTGVTVIETPDAVLIADENSGLSAKDIIANLELDQRDEAKRHRKVFRPWGWYDVVDSGDRFKVKRILVKPGASLSLQKHAHRDEHWVVVCGIAKVLNGDKTLYLKENDSTYIPRSTVHRLTNPGADPLEIIEVQSGDYLGEDDIVRLEDYYGRSEA